MYTDTHCHVLSTDYYDTDSVLSNLENCNIQRVIINGYNLESNKEVVALSSKYPYVYGALGMHPDNLDEDQDENLKYILEHIDNDKIIAIGEIGLDYYHNKDNKEKQINLLKKLLEIAEKNNLPVIIHNRDATDDLLRIVKEYHLKGIIHCFTGSIETAKEYIKLGYKLGIGGVLTFKNSKLRETLKEIPITSILLETDSPYLSPEPLRGLPNEPANLNFVAKELSKIYNLNQDELAEKLEKNYADIFDNR